MRDSLHGRPGARVSLFQFGSDTATRTHLLCDHLSADEFDLWLEGRWQRFRRLRPDELPRDQQLAYVCYVAPVE